jgi:tetratricopeptide (TPR) repeat protein
MIPTLTSLQQLAAFACVDNPHVSIMWMDSPHAEDLRHDIQEAHVISSRLVIYRSLQNQIEAGCRVLVDGLTQRTDLNRTTGRVLSWSSRMQRWAVQPDSGGNKIAIRPENMLPLFLRQEDPVLKETMAATASAVQQQAIQKFVLGNRRAESWEIIAAGYRACPFLVLNRAFEINDSGIRPILVKYASLVQGSMSQTQDWGRALRILNAMKRSLPSYVESRESYNVFYVPEDHEKIKPEDMPAARWFLLLVLLDAEKWREALDCLSKIFKDIESRVWPRYYLVEALYYAAIIEFALGNREPCRHMNKLYRAYGHHFDRHRYESGLLQLWIDCVSPDDFISATADGKYLTQMKKDLAATWNGSAFSPTPWVFAKVAEALGAEYESPYAPLILTLEKQWERVGGVPNFIAPRLDEFRRCGYPHGVTVRYRKTQADEQKEMEEGERHLRQMYEDRY